MMQAIKNALKKVSDWYRKLPDKKKYVEFVTALLSVPVMVTVIIINLNNLQQSKNASTKQQATPSTTPIQVVITGDYDTKKQAPPPLSPSPYITMSPMPSPTPVECKKQIGPVTILSPQEGEIVTKDTVCITLTTDSSYCPIIWSYSLNGGEWSDFTNKDICLYNVERGNKTIQLNIKSTVSDETVRLQRSFVYKNIGATPAATASATVE